LRNRCVDEACATAIVCRDEKESNFNVTKPLASTHAQQQEPKTELIKKIYCSTCKLESALSLLTSVARRRRGMLGWQLQHWLATGNVHKSEQLHLLLLAGHFARRRLPAQETSNTAPKHASVCS